MTWKTNLAVGVAAIVIGAIIVAILGIPTSSGGGDGSEQRTEESIDDEGSRSA